MKIPSLHTVLLHVSKLYRSFLLFWKVIAFLFLFCVVLIFGIAVVLAAAMVATLVVVCLASFSAAYLVVNIYKF